jgi:hypothetical protein
MCPSSSAKQMYSEFARSQGSGNLHFQLQHFVVLQAHLCSNCAGSTQNLAFVTGCVLLLFGFAAILPVSTFPENQRVGPTGRADFLKSAFPTRGCSCFHISNLGCMSDVKALLWTLLEAPSDLHQALP